MRTLILAVLALAPVALSRPPLPTVQCHIYWVGGAPCEVCRLPDGSIDLCGMIRIPRDGHR